MSDKREISLPSTKELERLTPEARKIYVGRCVLRVLPLLGYQGHFDYWEESAKDHLATMEAAALTYFLKGGHSNALKANFAAKLNNKITNTIPREIRAIPDAVTHAARVVANELAGILNLNPASATAKKAVDAASAATGNIDFSSGTVDATRWDYEKLIKQQQEGDLLSWFISKPLWPEGEPEIWHDVISKWQRALEGIGAKDVENRYARLMMGDPGILKECQRVVAHWYQQHGSEYGPKEKKGADFSQQKASPEEEETITGLDGDATESQPEQKQNTKTRQATDQPEKTPEITPLKIGQVALQLSDLPAEEDALGREELVHALADLLDYGDGQHITIGLMGSWGAGKSTLLKLLQKELIEREKKRLWGEDKVEVDCVGRLEHLFQRQRDCWLNGWVWLNSWLARLWPPCPEKRQPSLTDCSVEDSHRYLFAEFNAWIYEHTGNMQAGLAQEVVKGLTNDLGWIRRNWLAMRMVSSAQRIALYLWSGLFLLLMEVLLILWLTPAHQPPILSHIGVKDLGVNLGLTSVAGIGALFGLLLKGRQLFAQTWVDTFKTYLRLPDFGEYLGTLPVIKEKVDKLCRIRLRRPCFPRRLLLYVDDLDRCGVEGVVNTLESIRLVMDVPGVAVVIAVDERMALAALTQHYYELAEKGSQRKAQAIARDYLGKIFHLPISLSDPKPTEVENYIDKALIPKVIDDEQQGTELGGGEAGSGTIQKEIPEEDMTQDAPRPKPPNLPEEQGGTDEPDTTPGKPKEKRIRLLAKVAIKETIKEREWFNVWAASLGIANPRRLKRLLNSYRLMKAFDARRQGTLDLAWNLKHLAMLFWLEHLYECEVDQQSREEAYLVNHNKSRKELKFSLIVYNTLIDQMVGEGLKVEERRKGYSQLKRETVPFMLPFSHIVENGKSAKEPDREGEAMFSVK